jgi:hypothetical protein
METISCPICLEDINDNKVIYQCGHCICKTCDALRTFKFSYGDFLDQVHYTCSICREYIPEPKINTYNINVVEFYQRNPKGVPDKHVARSCQECGVIFTVRQSCTNMEQHAQVFCDQHLYAHVSTKKCPGCDYHIYRSSGCDHIKCTQCATDWCWECQYTFQAVHPYDHMQIRSMLCDRGHICGGPCDDQCVKDRFERFY